MAVCAFARSKGDSMKPVRESLMRYVEGSSSASYGLKLARLETLKGKVNSTFLLVYKILRLLRHTNVKIDQVSKVISPFSNLPRNVYKKEKSTIE
jgi:hypothetical protein